MSGTIDAGELKLTLKLMRENFAQGMKAVDADLKKLGATTEGAGKKGSSALGGLEKSLVGVGTQLVAMAGAYVGIQRLVAEFVAFGHEVTEVNRAAAAFEQAGYSMSGFREQLQGVGNDFIRFGQQENDAYRGFQRLIRATGDEEQSFKLLDTAMRFAAATGEDAGSVTQSLTSAFDGQEMMLKRLLMRYGVAETDLTGWTGAIEAMTGIADTATSALSDQDSAIYNLNASWDTFSDTLNEKATPAIVSVLDALSTLMGHPELLAGLATGSAKGYSDLLLARGQDYIDKLIGPAPFVGPKTGRGWVLENGKWVNKSKPKREPAPWGRGGGSGGDKAGAAPAPFDYAGLYGDYYDKNYGKLAESMQASLDEMDAAWLESTATWREGIDQTADSLAYLMLDLPTKGKDAWRAFVDSMLSMLRELAAEFISTTMKAQGLAFLKQLTGGAGGGGEYEEQPGFVGPHLTGIGGPRPLGPGVGSGAQPVYLTMRGDLTKYAEFKIVSRGLRQGRQAGF